MNEEVSRRIRCRKLLQKVVSPEEAVQVVQDGMTVGVGSDLLPCWRALERRTRGGENIHLHLWSGVAILEADRTLGIIKRRIGQQTLLRKAINKKQVEYLDLPLGFFYQSIRAGELGALDLAIVEAVGINEDGFLIPSYRLNDMANFIQAAKQVIVQLSTCYPLELEGIHDVYIPANPPRKQPIPICRVGDRVGTPYIPVEPEKIAFIYPSEVSEPTEMDLTIDETSRQIGKHLISFLGNEVSQGKLPSNLLPIEMGLGAIPAAVLEELGDSDFEDLEFYSAVLNDRVLHLIAKGKVKMASGTGFYLTAEGEKELFRNLPIYKKHIILRPVEIADCPEVIMRLGLLALNGGVEVDIYGHVNSSHILNGDIISGVGGASEFALNAFLSVILLPSTVKSGDISCIVPMVSHVDIPEHGVDLIVTEQGIADLRGCTPKERAERIIHCCAHPAYRPQLQDYFERAVLGGGAHEPHLLDEAFSFHQRFLKTGTMKR
ncbi:MAG: acetyl-CoA hydrolase [Proteobacteria bacterium]|nr:acetyl-CoA hydrolase [Pseudomonadota bacterium]